MFWSISNCWLYWCCLDCISAPCVLCFCNKPFHTWIHLLLLCFLTHKFPWAKTWFHPSYHTLISFFQTVSSYLLSPKHTQNQAQTLTHIHIHTNGWLVWGISSASSPGRMEPLWRAWGCQRAQVEHTAISHLIICRKFISWVKRNGASWPHWFRCLCLHPSKVKATVQNKYMQCKVLSVVLWQIKW